MEGRKSRAGLGWGGVGVLRVGIGGRRCWGLGGGLDGGWYCDPHLHRMAAHARVLQKVNELQGKERSLQTKESFYIPLIS